MNALARFAQAYPTLRLFDSTLGRNKERQQARNEWIFILFVQFLLERKSEATGKALRVNTIVSYVSLVKGFLGHKFGFDIIDDGPRLRRVIRELRESDPTAGMRKKRRGWRRHHFSRLERTVGPAVFGSASDPDALNEYAAASAAWQVLARGGEITTGSAGGWNAARDPSTQRATTSRFTRSATASATLSCCSGRLRSGARQYSQRCRSLSPSTTGEPRTPTQRCSGS